MINKFEQLDRDKRDKIINAGFKEFAINGYDKASTNKIVKDAEISKGLLFHYFGKKENLFLYLVEYSCKYIAEVIDLDDSIRDFFVIIEETMYRKINIFKLYPALFEFVIAIMKEKNKDIQQKIGLIIEKLGRDKTLDILKNVDNSLFKDDYDPEMIKFTVMSTLEKISLNELDSENYDIDKVVLEINKYIEFFKTVYYK